MNFVTYIDHRFQEVTMSQKDGKFSIFKAAEQESFQLVLKTVMVVLKTLFVPKILFGYFTTAIGITKRPVPAMDNLKAETEAKYAAAAEVSKAMLDKTSNVKPIKGPLNFTTGQNFVADKDGFRETTPPKSPA